jgi:(E)-4-hydroxy-3-methylbut-2-enyl-diphosphate synthase
LTYNSSIQNIGHVALGGKNPVRIQSMTTTNTMDTVTTVSQIKELVLGGCDLVRVTTRSVKEAENLKAIKEELLKIGLEVPLIADVHFNPKVAETAAQFVEKVRINPGNYIDNEPVVNANQEPNDGKVLEKIAKKLQPLLKICNQFGTAIRIGVNHGSLSERMLFKYGNTPLGMVESLMEFVQVCNNFGFDKLVLSLKASNVVSMIEANKLLVHRLSIAGLSYPIHLGVTEAGSGEEGRLKSVAGIGYLLAHGIGDTIRVSLTEDPLEEIPVAQKLVEYYGRRKDITDSIETKIFHFPKNIFSNKPPVVLTYGYSSFSDLSVDKYEKTNPESLHTYYSERNQDSGLNRQESKVDTYVIQKFSYKGLSYDDLLVKSATDISVILLDQKADGIWIENRDTTSFDDNAKLALSLLQVLGLRITKTEYIACPTCGRSAINVIEQLESIKSSTSNLPGLKIAVMGCSVNGPGEMAGSNYGCVGVGKGKVNIYIGSKIIRNNVPQKQATDTLIRIIKENSDWDNI